MKHITIFGHKDNRHRMEAGAHFKQNTCRIYTAVKEFNDNL